MQNITLRQISLDDVAALQDISRETFFETFEAQNSAENMQTYLEEALSLEKLATELNDKNAVFYFAEIENTAIGYLKLNFGASQTELKDNKALEIERIYVRNAYQGKKVGQLLYEKAIAVAQAIKADYVWLGVWEENKKAIGFYEKNGFVAFDKHIFRLGDDEQTDIMMKLLIRSEGSEVRSE